MGRTGYSREAIVIPVSSPGYYQVTTAIPVGKSGYNRNTHGL